MLTSDFDIDIVNAEISNLQNKIEWNTSSIKSLETNINRLFYKRAELISNLKLINAQIKDSSLSEEFRKILIEKDSALKSELANIQYQIDNTNNKFNELKSKEYSLKSFLFSRMKIFNSIVGDIVSRKKSEYAFGKNKELGRIKG